MEQHKNMKRKKTLNTLRFLSLSVIISAGIILFSCGGNLPGEVAAAYDNLPERVDFNFHIRPILADRCYQCHGPDDQAREANLRLDREGPARGTIPGSRKRAFVKGRLRASAAWQRISSDDPHTIMPPPESNLVLSAREKALIAKWIRQGAEWKQHWAFIPPEMPPVPEIPSAEGRNAIDGFIQSGLRQEGLTPAAPADRTRLIRRVTMDLTGLPPTPAEIDGFLADTAPDAYEKLVDRLFETEAYAERMTMDWLDIARFGDTQGLHVDAERYHWPWRDWVISAFRRNLPYDEFVTWQLAGDLLPNATREQKLATAFHRNHPMSSEGGIPDEEFRQKYVQDRTNTTATAFLGLTMECAACHDHKFDPISQKEYYQMSAFFNNLKEIGMVSESRIKPEEGLMHSSGPVLLLPDEETEHRLQVLQAQIDSLHRQRELRASEVAETQAFIAFMSTAQPSVPQPVVALPFESIRPYKVSQGVVHRSQNNSPVNQIVDNNPNSLACGEPLLVEGKKGRALRSPGETDIVFLKDAGHFEINEPYSAGGWVFTEKDSVNQTILGTSGAMGNAWRGWDLFLDSLNRPSVSLVSVRPQNYLRVTAKVRIPKEKWHHVFYTYDGSARAAGLSIYVDGKRVETIIDHDHLYGTILRRWRQREGWNSRPVMVFRSGRYHTGENGVFVGSLDELKLFDRCLSPLEVAGVVRQDSGDQKFAFDREDYLLHYLQNLDPAAKKQRGQLRELLGEKLRLTREVPEIMVLEDMPHRRKTFVLNRGQYDEPTEEVEPGMPEAVLSFPPDLPANRLGLAQWLFDERNPLTARVAVNRYWQMIFGTGIVATPHDFGIQGALPTHPQLLDWLALQFAESGWDVRWLLKTMVMSATYRQSSKTTDVHREVDPDNRLLARAPSYRLQAEMIRDNALAASGLLSRRVGGPSVKPYQPDGVWDFGALVSGPYREAAGADLYRRSMYTYIRRTSPHPAMIAFDAPDRLVCTARRENTNTPLQALVLLNDPQFVEAARVAAQRMQKEGGDTLDDQLRYGFRLFCGRLPGNREMTLMKEQYRIAREKYRDDPTAAGQLLAVGAFPFDETLDRVETAALTLAASTMLNFDEAYMKR